MSFVAPQKIQTRGGRVVGFGLWMAGMAEDPKGREPTESEIERRRDAALLRALSTPHKRQKEMKVGKRKARLVSPESARRRPNFSLAHERLFQRRRPPALREV